MRYWFHVTIAIVLTMLFAFVGVALVGIVAWVCIMQGMIKPIPYLGIVGPVFAWIGMDVASRAMALVPSRCPRCSGIARYHFVGWRWKNSLIPARQYGYECSHCGWGSQRRKHRG